MSVHAESAKLLRRQLDERFQKIREVPLLAPREGWIKTIRESLGMSATQLARKLGMTVPALSKLEASERKGTITLSTYQKIAEALDCQVALTLIPRAPLEKILKRRAQNVAEKIANRHQLQMNLEAQGTSRSFQETQVEDLSEELLKNLDKRLWEEP